MFYYIVIKAAFILLLNTTIYVQKRALSAVRPLKGNPADNAPIENFHSSLKCEAFYIKDEVITSSTIVIQIVENYIKYYNEKRIQQKLDYLSPVEYRRW